MVVVKSPELLFTRQSSCHEHTVFQKTRGDLDEQKGRGRGEFLMNWFCDTIHVLKISNDHIQKVFARNYCS